MTRQLARAVCQHKTANPILNPLIYRSTRRIANVPVRHEPRAYGRSGYRFRALVRLVLNNILSASNLPLRLISVLGTLSAAGSLLLGCFYLGVFLVRGIPVAGFTTQVLLIIFFGGMTLLSVGIVGEYLLRIFDEVRDSPRYVVARKRLGRPDRATMRRPDTARSDAACRHPPRETAALARPATRAHNARARHAASTGEIVCRRICHRPRTASTALRV